MSSPMSNTQRKSTECLPAVCVCVCVCAPVCMYVYVCMYVRAHARFTHEQVIVHMRMSRWLLACASSCDRVRLSLIANQRFA
jgi:hypothetical protein